MTPFGKKKNILRTDPNNATCGILVECNYHISVVWSSYLRRLWAMVIDPDEHGLMTMAQKSAEKCGFNL
jgi:hypothetical protein